MRRFIPRLLDPVLDAPVPEVPRDRSYEMAYADALPPPWREDAFLTARYAEGKRWRAVLDRIGVGGGPVLDIGAGTGAVALANAAAGRRMFTVDFVWNETARLAHAAAGAVFRHVIADANHLPFRDQSFEAIVCLEAIEHFSDAAAAGEESSRVLQSGGRLLLITPSRLAWVLRPDPHFGIRFLLLFPPPLQQWIAARRGFDQPHHFVDRIYTSARQIERLYPGCSIERVMTRSRLPKRFFWDAIVLRRGR